MRNWDRQDEEEEARQTGRRGGYAAAFDFVSSTRTQNYVTNAVSGAGLSALALLGFQIIANSPEAPFKPFRMYASMVLGEHALVSSTHLGLVIPTGLAALGLLYMLWGGIFGLILSTTDYDWTPGSVTTVGILFGCVVWLVNYYALAPLFWPWLRDLSSVWLFVGHLYFFGLPLGGWVSYHSET